MRMREDSCSGVGALKDREGPPSAPEGGVGSLCLKRSSMLLCSLRFRPYTHTHTKNKSVLGHNNRLDDICKTELWENMKTDEITEAK